MIALADQPHVHEVLQGSRLHLSQFSERLRLFSQHVEQHGLCRIVSPDMIDHVRRYYPTESVLLDVLTEEPESFAELAEMEPRALKHLVDMGLVSESDHRFELNSL